MCAVMMPSACALCDRARWLHDLLLLEVVAAVVAAAVVVAAVMPTNSVVAGVVHVRAAAVAASVGHEHATVARSLSLVRCHAAFGLCSLLLVDIAV